MKRNWLLNLILVGMAVTVFEEGHAQNLNPDHWSLGLSARVRWEDSNPIQSSSDKQFTSLRLRSSLAFTGIENLKVLMEPQYNKILGRQNGTIETSGNASYDGAMDGITMRSALLDFMLYEQLHLIVGRQTLVYGDQYVLGLADWGPYGRTWDGAKFKYTSSHLNVDLFQAKVVESNWGASSQGTDKDLLGTYMTLFPSHPPLSLDFYGFYLSDEQKTDAPVVDATRPWHFGVYGTRLVSHGERWSGRLEVAKTYGKEGSSAIDRATDNYMIDGQVNYLLAVAKKHSVGLRVFSAGTQWRDLAPSPHGLFGRTDLFGRRNLTGARLRWNAEWSDDLSTSVDIFTLNKTNKGSNVYLTDSKTQRALTGSSSESLGYETDINVKKQWNKNLFLSAGVNLFFFGPYFSGQNGNAAHFGYFMIEARY